MTANLASGFGRDDLVMKPSGIRAVDDLLAGTGAPIGTGSDPAAVGAVQDLLRGHGFDTLPGLIDPGHGVFGADTVVAVASFRAGAGLPPSSDTTGAVQRDTLAALVAVVPSAPIASQAYLTLVLGLDFKDAVRLAAIVAQAEGAGKFAAMNLNHDHAGLSFGILQWDQKSGALHDLLTAFKTAQPKVLNALLGGPNNVNDLITLLGQAGGGVDANGNTTNPKFDLIHEPWITRFLRVGLHPALQPVQATAAGAAFQAFVPSIPTQTPKLTSERAAVFVFDLTRQFGAAGAKTLYDQTETGATDQKVLMRRLRDASTAKLAATFPTLPQIAHDGLVRRDFFINTGLLSDSDLPSVPPGPSPIPTSTGLNRYFQPENLFVQRRAPVFQTKVTPFIGGPDALPAMAKDIAGATHPGDFIYLLNWFCDINLQLVTGDPNTTLLKMLTDAAGTRDKPGAQLRAMFWGTQSVTIGVAIPLEPSQNAPALDIPLSPIPNFQINTDATNFIEGLATTSGADAAAIFDTRYRRYGSHHQKVLVVRNQGKLVAYVGGIEYKADRLSPEAVSGIKGSPLFDVSVRLEDDAAWLALDTFVQRWQAHPNAHGTTLLGASMQPPKINSGTLTVQMTHTYGVNLPFPLPIVTASDARANGISRANKYFYFEDQYWVGNDKLLNAITSRMSDSRNGGDNVIGIVVIAAEDCVDDLKGVGFRRRDFMQKIKAQFPTRFFVFERVGVGGSTLGANAYVHSKLLLIDDEAAFIGSVNSSRRSWSHDSEVDATIVDASGPGGTGPGTRGWVRDFRCTLWNKHLPAATPCTGDPDTDLQIWLSIAQEPLGTVKGMVRRYDIADPHTKFPPDFLWDSAFDPA